MVTLPVYAQKPIIAKRYTVADSKREASKIRTQLEREPRNSVLWSSLGLELMFQMRFNQAIVVMENAVAHEPSNPDYVFRLQFAHIRSSSLQNRRKLATKSLQKNPQDTHAYIVRGISYLNEGRLDEALVDINNALVYDPKHAIAFALKADILATKSSKAYKLGPTSESIDYLKQSVDVLKDCLTVCGIDNPAFGIAIEERKSLIAYWEAARARSDEKEQKYQVPLRLRTRPRPAYTQTARTLNIEGTVIIAVMFKSDGTIGPIFVSKKIAGGLISKAIEAARRIEFEPEKRDGKPVDVVKIIAYKFSIF